MLCYCLLPAATHAGSKLFSIMYTAAADSHAGCQVAVAVVTRSASIAVADAVFVATPGRNQIRKQVVGESTMGVHATTKFLLGSWCLARTIGGGGTTRDRHPPPAVGGRLLLPSLGVASHCRAGLNQLVNNALGVGNGILPGGAVQRQVEGVHRDAVVRPDDVMA